MINENLQTLHISNPLSSLLQLLSFLKLLSVLALILLFIVPHQIWYQSMAFNCSYN
jgi:hypothetical protein